MKLAEMRARFRVVAVEAPPVTVEPPIPAIPPIVDPVPPSEGGGLDWKVYHYKEGKSDKWWAIARDVNYVYVRWGRNGSAGQKSDPIECATILKACRYVTKRIRQQLDKGYKKRTDWTGWPKGRVSV